MPHPIRMTAFTWDPEHESRAAVWNRLKRHIQGELDRIHEAAVLQRQLARRRASPHYARNRQIFEAARQGLSDRDIAHRHGLSPMRVREIIRTEQRWYTRYDPGYATLRDEHPARHDSAFELDDMPAAIPRPLPVMRDP